MYSSVEMAQIVKNCRNDVELDDVRDCFKYLIARKVITGIDVPKVEILIKIKRKQFKY